MGISGLLPVLKDITNRSHVKHFAGKRAVIDGYSWLYKGAYSCPRELCEGIPTDKCAPLCGLMLRTADNLIPKLHVTHAFRRSLQCRFVKFCMSRIRLLLHHGVIPIVIFDGDKLPAKDCTEIQRQRCEIVVVLHDECHASLHRKQASAISQSFIFKGSSFIYNSFLIIKFQCIINIA